MKTKALKAAFPHTIPVFAGYLFLGIAYGIYMNASGFPFYYPTIISILIFGGSLQFVAVELLLSPYAPLSVFLLALLIQARHLFYGLSVLDKYKGTGKKKLYLIYALSDETFSVNCSVAVPKDVDKGWFYFFISLLDQFYWVLGSTIGGVFGSLLNINADGISFVLTAMFVVIFLEQFLKEKTHVSSYLGVAVSIVCLLIFGPDSFMVPTMIGIIAVLTVFRKPFEQLEVL